MYFKGGVYNTIYHVCISDKRTHTTGIVISFRCLLIWRLTGNLAADSGAEVALGISDEPLLQFVISLVFK